MPSPDSGELQILSGMWGAPVKTVWGIFDTEDRLWLGDDLGPAVFDDEKIAQVAARVADVRLRQKPGRCQAKELPENRRRFKCRDEKAAHMTVIEALRGLEEGRYI